MDSIVGGYLKGIAKEKGMKTIGIVEEESKEEEDCLSLQSENFEKEFEKMVGQTSANLLIDGLGGQIPSKLLQLMQIGTTAIIY